MQQYNCLYPTELKSDCLSDLEHDHIYEELFLYIFGKYFLLYCACNVLLINTRSEFSELISMFYTENTNDHMINPL
jgi:hypothetical protein